MPFRERRRHGQAEGHRPSLALPEALDFGRRGRDRGARRGAGGEGLATAKARFEFLASLSLALSQLPER
jgi:hypothetical protein